MNYTMQDAANALKISRRRLQDIVQKHPYYYVNGNRKLFTQEDVDRIVEAMREEGRARRTPIRYSDPVPSASPERAMERVLKLLAEPDKRSKLSRHSDRHVQAS